MTKPPRKKPAKAGAKNVAPAVRRMPPPASSRTGVSAAPRDPSALSASAAPPDGPQVAALVRDLGHMIDAARQQVAVAANTALTTLYWQLGHRVGMEVLKGRRAEYGAQIVAAVGRQLETRYGRGFGEEGSMIAAVTQLANVQRAVGQVPATLEARV